jgi:hypothetical protein
MLVAVCAAATVVLAGAGLRAADTDQIEIVTGAGSHRFEVEVALSPAERAKGLMFRRHMADDAGMLFDFGGDEFVTMWMRNTYIPLDMVFAFADGTIHRIEANTEPFSERTIASGEPVRYVLEIRGGRARELGIEPGDRLVGDRIDD